MKTLLITKGMTLDEPESLKDLCLFLGMSEETFEDEVYYFTNGEGFNYNGFTNSESSETEIVINEGDYIINVSGKFKLVKAELSFLVVDSLAADRMERFLDEIYQSGDLGYEMSQRYMDFFSIQP